MKYVRKVRVGKRVPVKHSVENFQRHLDGDTDVAAPEPVYLATPEQQELSDLRARYEAHVEESRLLRDEWREALQAMRTKCELSEQEMRTRHDEQVTRIVDGYSEQIAALQAKLSERRVAMITMAKMLEEEP